MGELAGLLVNQTFLYFTVLYIRHIFLGFRIILSISRYYYLFFFHKTTKQSNMRRGRRGTEDSIDVIEEKPEPEFARLKLKKAASTACSIEEKEMEGASSELKKKLMKQKSVA